MLSRSALVIFLILFAEFMATSQAIRSFGFLITLAMVIGLSLLGVLVIRFKAAGLVVSTMQSLADDTSETPEVVADRALGLAAGALMVFPGLVTGVLGLILLFPPVRQIVGPHVLGWVTQRASSINVFQVVDFSGSGDPRRNDGSVIDVDEVPTDGDPDRPSPRSELD